MNKNELPMLVPTPKIGGRFLKLKSGEVVKIVNFDPANQVYEFKSSNGEICKVHQQDIIKILTPNEETEFLKIVLA